MTLRAPLSLLVWTVAVGGLLGCPHRVVSDDDDGGASGEGTGGGSGGGGSGGGGSSGGGAGGGDDCVVEPAAASILPRTSNEEFRSFVTDLLGRPVDAERFAGWTPLAQVNGFDTMTESRVDAGALQAQLQTVEELAAELMATPAIMEGCPTPTDPPPACADLGRYDASAQFGGAQNASCWTYRNAAGAALTFSSSTRQWIDPNDPGLFLWDNGMHPGIRVDVMLRWTAPRDGVATFVGSFFDADPGGGDGVVVVLRGPPGDLFRAVIVNGGAAETLPPTTVPVRRGQTVDLVVERVDNNSYDTTGHALVVDFAAAPPSGGRTWANCGRTVVERVASRAFRRPLRPGELESLQTVFDETAAAATEAGLASVFPEALGAALQATLLSPHVLYKPEFVPGGFDDVEDQHRLASRLALYFRGSLPDNALRALADAGRLDDEATLVAEAERLLAEDGDRFVEHFGGQWLDFRAVGSTTPVSTDPLRVAMRREAHAVFAAVLADGLPPERLVRPGFTFVDGGLAAHYGLDVDPGADVDDRGFTRVATAERGGLFTQGHFLTSTATGSDFKRVIHRGLFTLGRTLCQAMPMLDPATREEINNSVGQIDPEAPLGEQMQVHRNSGERCTACHAQMDPLGLALERFDPQGLARDRYADGSSVDNSFDFHGTSVRNPAELAAFIEGSDEYRRCVAEKLFTWGLHRAPRRDERCVIDALAGLDDDGPSPPLQDMSVAAFLAALRMTEAP